jgi:hypothetical protein
LWICMPKDIQKPEQDSASNAAGQHR